MFKGSRGICTLSQGLGPAKAWPLWWVFTGLSPAAWHPSIAGSEYILLFVCMMKLFLGEMRWSGCRIGWISCSGLESVLLKLRIKEPTTTVCLKLSERTNLNLFHVWYRILRSSFYQYSFHLKNKTTHAQKQENTLQCNTTHHFRSCILLYKNFRK